MVCLVILDGFVGKRGQLCGGCIMPALGGTQEMLALLVFTAGWHADQNRTHSQCDTLVLTL